MHTSKTRHKTTPKSTPETFRLVCAEQWQRSSNVEKQPRRRKARNDKNEMKLPLGEDLRRVDEEAFSGDRGGRDEFCASKIKWINESDGAAFLTPYGHPGQDERRNETEYTRVCVRLCIGQRFSVGDGGAGPARGAPPSCPYPHLIKILFKYFLKERELSSHSFVRSEYLAVYFYLLDVVDSFRYVRVHNFM